jgi:transposase
MFKVELYGRVRRAVLVDGMSQRTAAREFGISRKSVRKMVAFSAPPGYRREQPAKRPKLGPWVGVIDAILEDDKQRPAKQRHTAKRVWERLREEHQFTGGYTIVKDYLRSAAQRGRERFVPLTHPAGEAQADFGEAVAVIGGVECKAHYLAIDLPHSDDCFVVAFPAETTEAFLEGHVRAFAYFGGVPTRILYDNTKIAVAKILGGTERQRTRVFSELESHYLFADKFGRPAKGNDKGKVEGLVGYARRNFMVPVPRFATWDAFNAHLEAECRKRRIRKLRGHMETISERFERDKAAFLTLAEEVQQVTGGSVELAFVDQGYTGSNAAEAAEQHGLRLEVVKHPMAKRGFVLLPRRWVVERSFAWAARFRRLARDYERLDTTLKGIHLLAFATLMLRNLADTLK